MGNKQNIAWIKHPRANNRLTFVKSQIQFTHFKGVLRHIELYSRREIQREKNGYFISYLHFRETAVQLEIAVFLDIIIIVDNCCVS